MCFSTEIDPSLPKLAKKFKAEVYSPAYENLKQLIQQQQGVQGQEHLKNALGLKRRTARPFKVPGPDHRIYPNYFAPVITLEHGKRLIRPMRYRIRPYGSKHELPAKYNVFNARLDSLEDRRLWKNSFCRRHGIFPFRSFYEWVEGPEGGKKLIHFRPEGIDLMWAPCLFERWHSEDGSVEFESFALITDDPPPEIKLMGHDRCPIFIDHEHIGHWLDAEKLSVNSAYKLLKRKEEVHYEYEWAA